MYLSSMPRILAIDYGTKRVGLAVTDPSQIIATALDTVPAHEIIAYLKKYVQKEAVECFVVGEPKTMMGKPSEITPQINAFLAVLNKEFPQIPVKRVDERFTSGMAFQTMIDAGVKKMDRRDKGTVDRISATIILQSYLAMKK